ncbi:MAG: GTP cyclohydrolase II RibA [Deltaproteobacteria bacterium]|nr:GTP cyclohydrolase II RibA [Deltaproteobacteria bacterium]
MFSYIDPSVKKDLMRDHKLVLIDERGRPINGAGTSPFISIVGPVPLPIQLPIGARTFLWYAAVRHSDLDRIEGVVNEVREKGPRMLFALLADHMAVNSALVYGDFAAADSPLVRVHSNCLTGDVFGSMRCDCGPQLQAALEQIARHGAGAVIYMAGHEGRGIGLWAKAITYLLQDAGQDTYQANERLGLPTDSRDFSDAGRVLLYLLGGNKRVRLLGNNPLKRKALEEVGIEVAAQVPLVVGVNPFNARYLDSKREHGHLIPLEAVRGVGKPPTT